MSAFTVMVKPVGSRCNMRCTYCYYLEKGKYSSHTEQTILSDALLDHLIRQSIECNVRSGSAVSFVWHGGEPTLAGLDFYRRALELEKKYAPTGWRIFNNLQTNGLLLDDAWCDFLQANHFDVGISIDGCEQVHDQNRRDLGGRGTWERVRASVERLKARGLRPDLLCTVNAASAQDPLAVYHALRDLDTGWMQFIPILVRQADGSLSAESVTPAAYGNFLCAIFDEWITHDLGRTDVQLFAETARIWNGGRASVCFLAPTCGNVLIAEEDGSIYACDHFVDDKHRLGRLKRSNLEDLADSPFQQTFGRSKREGLTGSCKACPWLSCCQGGCPKDRFGRAEDGEEGQYYLCEGLRQFFAHAKKPVRLVTRWTGEGAGPEEIMERMRQRLSAHSMV